MEQVDAHSLGWAMSATSSRAFGFGSDDKRLLPLIDMMNHAFEPSARVALKKKKNADSKVEVSNYLLF